MYRIFLLLIISSLLSCKKPLKTIDTSQMSPAESFESMSQALGNHEYDIVWQYLPKKWQKAIEDDIRNIGSQIPKDLWEKYFKTLNLLADTLEQKKVLLAELFMTKDQDKVFSKNDVEESLVIFAQVLRKVSASSIASHDDVTNFNAREFLHHNVNEIMQLLCQSPLMNRMSKMENDKTLKETFEIFKNIKVTNREKPGDVTVKLDLEKPFDTAMRSIAGRWLPKEIATIFTNVTSTLSVLKEGLKESNFSMTSYGVIGAIEGACKSIQQAKNLADLEELLYSPAFSFFGFGGGSQIDRRAIDREKRYQGVQAEVLAKVLAKNYIGNGKCLLIHHPGLKGVKRITQSFKKGFQGKVSEIRLTPIKVLEEDLEFDMTENNAEDFNKVIKENDDCDLIILMVSPPNQIEEMNKVLVLSDGKKTVGIYNGYIGNLSMLFEENKIQAMSIWKPNPTIDEQPVPKDLQKAFDKRYMIVTPNNLSEIRGKYPRLFPKPRK